jgi:hypothetical protein
MTPKEKAEELFSKYYNSIEHTLSEEYSPHEMFVVKQCALIAVNEILSSGIDVDYYFDKSVGYMISYVEYYQEVKQEIEKI